MQYTIRNVPPALDQAIRDYARRQGKSLNDAVLEHLAHAFGVASTEVKRDLSAIVGTWVEDPDVDDVLAAQRVIDEEMW